MQPVNTPTITNRTTADLGTHYLAMFIWHAQMFQWVREGRGSCMLYKMFLTFKSVDETRVYDHSNKSY